MAVDVSLMRAYTDGLVATHDAGATGVVLPTNASSALSADFTEVGAITSDGITETTSQDRKDVYIWQDNTLARRIPGQYAKTFKFAAAETNLMTLGVQFASSTVAQTATGVTVTEKAPGTDERAWVLHGIDGSRLLRIVVPIGEVTERGDVVWSAENVTVYEWTLSCYVDTNGVVAYRYYLDSDLASGS